MAPPARVGPDDAIVVLSLENPHKPGTAAHRRHACLRTGTRVRDYVAGAIPEADALRELVRAHAAGAIGFANEQEKHE